MTRPPKCEVLVVDPSAVPDIDENGVDRAQIRAMLELTPMERLRRLSAFVTWLNSARHHYRQARIRYILSL